MQTITYEQVKQQALYLPREAQQTLRSALALPVAEQQQLLTELPARPTVRVSRVPGKARDFSLEQQWLRENKHLYRGEHLAVSGSQLIAHSANPHEVLAAADASGMDFLLAYSPSEEEIPYGGGLWL